MKAKKIYWLKIVGGIFFLSLMTATVWSQKKFYTAISESPLVVGQTFQVQYIVENPNDVPPLRLPGFSSFIVHDSFDSKSTILQSGAGMLEIYSKIVVLSVGKAGRYIIPGAKVFIDGKWQSFNSLKIEIVKDGLSSTTESLPPDIPIEKNAELREGESITKKISDNLFLRSIATKTRCYAGEGVMVTYKFYSRINASSQVLKRPSLTGFSVVEMVDGYESKPDIEMYNGQRYYVNLVRKVQLFPLQPGKFLLEPAQISSTVHFMKMGNEETGRGDDFDQLLQKGNSNYNRRWRPFDYTTTVQSQPLTLEAIPLPEKGQPENFSGGIGKFTLSLVAPTEPIHAGELIKVRLIINGTGNIPLIIPPVVNWPKGVDTAEPVVKEVYNKYVFPLQGYKSFEYSFTIPDTGLVQLPAAKFYYFNPENKSYQLTTTHPITLTIMPALLKVLPVSNEPVSGTENGVPRQIYWFAVIAILIVSWILFQIFRGRGKNSDRAPVSIAPNIATPVALPDTKELLSKARDALANNDPKIFYRELQGALWKITGDYCGLRPSEQNKQNIRESLRSKNTPDDVITSLINIQQECDWALYTTDPAAMSSPHDLLEKAAQLVEFFRK